MANWLLYHLKVHVLVQRKLNKCKHRMFNLRNYQRICLFFKLVFEAIFSRRATLGDIAIDKIALVRGRCPGNSGWKVV